MSDVSDERMTKRRVQDGLDDHLRPALEPFVSEKMMDHYGDNWPERVSRARGAISREPLDPYALLKTIIDNWMAVFSKAFDRSEGYRLRGFVSTAFEARNKTSHLNEPIPGKVGLRYLDAMYELAKCVNAPKSEIEALEKLYDEQLASTAPTTAKPERPVHPTHGRGTARRSRDWSAFKKFLMTIYKKKGSNQPLGANSADSYCSYLNNIEKHLDIDLKAHELTDPILDSLIHRLCAVREAKGIPGKYVSDWCSGLRAYAVYRRTIGSS